ncbi:MAG TPA: hypothetical protein ACFE0H_07680, partial [Elainellaceae cyanobacterium]
MSRRNPAKRQSSPFSLANPETEWEGRFAFAQHLAENRPYEIHRLVQQRRIVIGQRRIVAVTEALSSVNVG